MKIAYFSTSVLISDSANSVHATRMSQALAKQGHDVTLHGLRGDGDKEAVFAYYGVEPIFRVVRHDEQADALAGCVRALRKRLPALRVGGLPSVLYGRGTLSRQIRSAAPDLVYARNLNWLAGLAAPPPYIAESHRPPRNRVERYLEARLYRHRKFRKLVVISDRLKELYTRIFPWLAPRIQVAHDAADDPLPDSSVCVQPSGFNVGYVGHLYAGRGIELILALARAVPEATFHVVGGREQDRHRLSASADLGNVIFHGHWPPHALPKFFRTFDVVLAPYQTQVRVAGNRGDTSAYMSPLKIFEYMSWGKAILSSDMPVLREILVDGENAILLPPTDTAKWIDTLRRVMRNETARHRLGARARKDFLAKHSWDKRARSVLA